MSIEVGQITEGRCEPQGSTCAEGGVNFAVFSSVAEKIELCLFDVDGTEQRMALPGRTGDVWHGHVAGLGPGQRYGFRVHGPWDPRAGNRCCAEKLLADPYARAFDGVLAWDDAFFPGGAGDVRAPLNRADSGPFMLKSVVVDVPSRQAGVERPCNPLDETVLYELHVRGFTARHPGIPPELRGTFAGLAHPAALGHLRRLGVTAVELMPVQHAVDRRALVERGRVNYWGYDPVQYFALQRRYAASRTPLGAIDEFRDMVAALHGAGIEVILDVVFNHTAEGDENGAMLCFKGFDNAAYYRLRDDRSRYLNITGTDHTVNAGHPQVRRMIRDALRYWAGEMNVDGFRLDLAAAIGRHGDDLDFRAGFLEELRGDPLLADRKLIAEPWDLAHDGHQLGRFPGGWMEWNDRFRDDVRDYWLRRARNVAPLALRVAGSPDVFHADGRPPQSSINYVTSHDGFTLRDLVTCEATYNHANGEENRDGMRENRSWNCGVEGETEDAWIQALRDRERRNLLATLLLSQGIPMLLAGDEIGRTQRGNNNAYCQDNEVSWVDWENADHALSDFVRALIRLRREHPALRRTAWLVARDPRERRAGLRVYDAHAREVVEAEPLLARGAVQIFIPGRVPPASGDGTPWTGDADFVLACNPGEFETTFSLPPGARSRSWWKVVDTARPGSAATALERASGAVTCRPHSMIVLMGCEPAPAR